MCWCNGNGGTLQPSLLAPTHMWYLKGRFVPVSDDDADGDGEGRFLLVKVMVTTMTVSAVKCSLPTSCMMERGASLIISPRGHPVHVSRSYHSVHPLMDYVLLIKHDFV